MRHPAKFNADILTTLEYVLESRLEPDARVLDPFAGTGKIHLLPWFTVGVEIEPEWAELDPRNLVGSALHLPFAADSFDAIATSPTYGNRMADHHEAKDNSFRATYRHLLGRKLHRENSGQLQWGREYQDFHRMVWTECHRVTRRWFVLNIKDHIRSREVQRVTAWHQLCLEQVGFKAVTAVAVPSPGLRHGQNSDVRVEHESVIVFEKETA